MKLFAKNPDELIRASWAEWIKSIEEVPDIFKGFFVFTPELEFPYTVRTPTYQGFIHPTVEKLICDLDDKIYVLEQNENTFDKRCYPLQGISYIEVKTILLNSSIKICGVTEDGLLESSTFIFNSVTYCLFTPFIQKMRHAEVDLKSLPHPNELEKFDHWHCINLKFMNYAKRSLLVDERVIYAVLQPEIREQHLLRGLRRKYKMIAPAVAGILTDRELIMIREEKMGSGEERYGGTWDFIPLVKIMNLSLEKGRGNLLTFSIHLTEGTCLEFKIQTSLEKEINRLQYHFQELMIS